MDPVEAEIDTIIEATTKHIDESEEVEEVDEAEEADEVEEVEEGGCEREPWVPSEQSIKTTTNDKLVSSDDKSVVDSQNIEVFNIALHQYLKIDEEIKVLLEAIKIRNKTKKNLADTLGTYLRANEIRNVNLGGSYKGKKLETKVTYTSKGFSKENVTKVLYDELKEEAEIFDKIMESMSRTNVITEKWNLKIINEKEKSTKSKSEKAKNKIDIAEELLNEEEE